MSLHRLHKDFAELQQLRTEVTQLRAQMQEVDKLRAENQQLALAVQQKRQANANDDFFARNDDKAESIACINNLKQIGLAARILATDNSDVFPSSWLAMANVLGTPKILVCPSDKGRTPARNWAEFSSANVSYEFLNPNGTAATPYVLLTRCPIHGNVGLSDGSAWMGSGLGSSFTISVQDGKQVFTPLNQPANSSPSEVLRQRYGLPPNTNAVPPARSTNVNYE